MMFKQRLILIVALAVIHVVNGQRSPDVTVQDATVRLRKDAIINCTYTIFDGRTLSGVTWYKSTSAGAQGDRLVSSAVGSNPNGRYSVETSQAGVTTLTISNALLSDDGFYQCAVTDSGILTTSHFGSLTVQYLDDVMIDISSNTTANVTITCSANGSPPPMMNLLKDDVVIDTENNSPLTYTIGNVTESDGGSYKCTATNSVGSKESETIVLHYFKPGVTLDPDEATVGPGSIVTMTAIVTANPDDITYNWTTDDPEIVVTDTSSSTFTFKVPESAEDGTEYIVTVEVTNSIGSTTQSAKITVKNPCTGEPCKNGGTCNIVEEGYNCSCTDDFFGFNCSICIYEVGCDHDEGDRLIYGNCTCGCACGEGRYICDTKNLCENYCASTPCQNEGTCIPAKCNFTCNCTTDYSGPFCEVYNPCADQPCENGGTCIVDEGGYICNCTNDFTGLNCSNCNYEDSCNQDEWDNIYINENGTCECICGAGRQFDYVTNRCEKTCSLSCQNGGTCQIVNNTENCTCPTGFEGQYCENNRSDENSDNKPTPRPTPPEPTTGPPSEGLETWVIVIIIIIIVIFVLLSIGILIYIICCYDEWSRLSTELKSACVVVCLLGFGIIVVLIIIYYERKENGRTSKLNDPPNDPTSGPVVPQEDVEMKQSKENSDLKRYAASGGELYTEVNLKDKKKKPDNDTGSSKPAPVDMNVEGLQYADLDLTRNLPTGKKDVINHPDQETTYSSIQTQRI